MNIKPIALLAVMLSAQTTVHAATLDNKALTEKVISLEKQNSALTKQVTKMETVSTKRIGNIKQIMTARDERIRFNGFLSAMATKNRKNLDLNFEGTGIDDRWSFSPDSIVGMQWDYKVVEGTSATVQAVAKGAKGFEVEAEWMYLTHQLTDNVSIRAGRLRLPLYALSETFEVGFSYPWVRPPVDLYIADVTSYEGVAITHKGQWGDWFLTSEVWGGSIDEELVKIREEIGTDFVLSNGPWEFRLLGARVNKQIIRAFEATTSPASLNYVVWSNIYDDGNWLIHFELADLAASKENPTTSNYTGYLSLAKHINSWTPYVVAGFGDSDQEQDEGKRNADLFLFTSNLIPKYYHEKTYSVGLRYDVNPKMALKFDATYFYDIKEDEMSRIRVSNPTTRLTDPTKVALLGDNTTILTFGTDIVF